MEHTVDASAMDILLKVWADVSAESSVRIKVKSEFFIPTLVDYGVFFMFLFHGVKLQKKCQTRKTFWSFALYIFAKPFVYGRLRAFLSVLFCLLSNM